jgi:DMSO/TMAO reductase YedYZ molybdopterin-dependent catalytic subunit/nitrite reductase/ring-hydroxylating ferredoxin subunit
LKRARVTMKRGYTDNDVRIAPGWRVAQTDKWPINNDDPGESDFDIKAWRFETYGAVEEPLSLTHDEFHNLPHLTKTLDHHCIDGWSYLGQVWNGVEISVVKEKTRVSNDAKFVLVEGAGGVSQIFTLSQDLLLADGQNNSALSRPAGFPLRVIAPGEFGNRSVKWVKKIKFCTERELDSRDRKYMECGIHDVYLKEIFDRNPWNVDNKVRKMFLQKLFAHNTEERRKKKQSEHISRRTGKTTDNLEVAVPLCKVDDLQESAGSKFIVNGKEILLIKSGKEIYAIEPLCTHHGSDLSKGKLDTKARTVRCPLHGAIFDIASGTCLLGSYGSDGDTFPSARTYRTRIESGIVLVERNQDWGPL